MAAASVATTVSPTYAQEVSGHPAVAPHHGECVIRHVCTQMDGLPVWRACAPPASQLYQCRPPSLNLCCHIPPLSAEPSPNLLCPLLLLSFRALPSPPADKFWGIINGIDPDIWDPSGAPPVSV